MKKKYEPKKQIVIDRGKIETEEGFIWRSKKALGLSTVTGLNWMAMDDRRVNEGDMDNEIKEHFDRCERY